jgi:hypothetical protein
MPAGLVLAGVAGAVVGLLLALVGAALAFMGLAAVVEGVTRRGLVGCVCGLGLLAAGLWMTGFLG